MPRAGSWRKPTEGRRLLFQSPWAQSAFVVNLGGLFFVSPLIYFPDAFSPHSYRLLGKFGCYCVLLLYFGMTYGITLLLLWAIAPQETRIDLEKGVCLHSRGWRWRRKTWTIPLGDAASVCIHSRNGLYLKLKPAKYPRLRVTLAGSLGGDRNSRERSQARRLAEELAALLGLPIEEDPRR